MDYKDNATVDTLRRYLPFDAGAGNLYEEHVPPDSRLDVKTQALQYLKELCGSRDTQLVVLTGNAGHGKTHLCRRLLQEIARDPASARAIFSDLLGSTRHAVKNSGRPIRVIKDLSEVPESLSPVLLVRDLLEDQESVGIVCANEGRLRHVASQDGSTLRGILDSLERTVEGGLTTCDGRIFVVNLNHQSVAPGQDGFISQVLDYWTDGRRWSVCQHCACQRQCPFFGNRNYLADSNPDAAPARSALIQLVRTVEACGQVITFRDALIFIAYVLTGGLRSCRVVHEMSTSRARRLADYNVETLIFQPELDRDQTDLVSILDRIQRFDPGRVALRDVDHELHKILEERGLFGNDSAYSAAALASSKRELEDERRRHLDLIRQERRRDFFSTPPPGRSGDAERARRMGFRFFDEFETILHSEPDSSEALDILELVIRGLHAVQGVRSTSRDLCIVDPAFAREGNTSAVVARTIPRRRLELMAESRFWAENGLPSPHDVTRSCAWIDRRVVLVLRDDNGTNAVTNLDLLQFEFVLRAADGAVFETFHAADRRRILARLAMQAEGHELDEDTIRIIDGSSIRLVWVERDGRIQVGDQT